MASSFKSEWQKMTAQKWESSDWIGVAFLFGMIYLVSLAFLGTWWINALVLAVLFSIIFLSANKR